MDVLQIVRESTELLSAKLSHLFLITITLLFPVSSIILSQVFSHGDLPHKLSTHFEDIAHAARLLENPFNRIFYLRLSQTLLSQALCFPVIVTLYLLAKTAILYIIGCDYQHKEVSIVGFLTVGPKLWMKLIGTYLWICMMVLGFVSVVILSPVLVIGVLDALDLPPIFVGLVEMPLVVFYSVVFAHMTVVSNLAHIVTVVEDRCGGAALLKAMFLLKGKMQLGLLLFSMVTLIKALVEYMFEYRMLGNSRASIPLNALLWEAPLLICMYSFVYLFDTIMTFVLYQSCKASDWDNNETQYTLEHFSIAVEMMEQCRKMYAV